MVVQIDGVPYSFEARHPNDISKLWQIFQICFYICSTVVSFTVIFTFSYVIVVMKHNCILDAELCLVRKSDFSVNNTNNASCAIDTVRSKFYNKPCNIVMFTPVITTTIACFFAFMFVMCGRGGAGGEIPDAWRLVFPTIIVNLISFCLMLYAAIIFQSGVNIFLNGIKQTWSVHKIHLSDINCLELEGKQIGEKLSNVLERVRLYIWLVVTLWGLSLFLIVLRFLFAVDFQLVQITICSHPDITMPHEPLIENDRSDIIEDDSQNVIQDSKDSGSDVSDNSYHTAQSELTQPESYYTTRSDLTPFQSCYSVQSEQKSKKTVFSQPEEWVRTVHFDDNVQEFPNNRTFTQLRDASTSTDASLPGPLNMPEEKE